MEAYYAASLLCNESSLACLKHAALYSVTPCVNGPSTFRGATELLAKKLHAIRMKVSNETEISTCMYCCDVDHLFPCQRSFVVFV